MSMQKRLTVVLFCLIAISPNLFSQVVLQGIVTDNGGEYLGNVAEPIVNALVTITDQTDPIRTFSTHTDDQGNYAIQITQTGVDGESSINPGDFRLLQNYPNPFNPSTVIGYQLTRPSHIRIEIYNVLGRKIKTLLDGFESSGSGQIIWYATDDYNQGVPAGLYIYSLQAGDVRLNRKMLLIDGHQGDSRLVLPNAMGKDGSNHRCLSKTMSNQYQLQVTGENIETYEQQDLVITENTVLDITVYRTVTDIDGNVYRTVKIGSQWWMKENLKVTRYRNGDAIPNVTDSIDWLNLTTGARCDYDNDDNNVATYGRLYNWCAVNDSRSIAPAGWHVPGDEEWKKLEMYLGMSQSEADNRGYRGTDEGGKLKEAGTEHWVSPNTGATNVSSFSALPGGWRWFDGGFTAVGLEARFWSSSSAEIQNTIAWSRMLNCYSSNVHRNYFLANSVFSIRCVRD